MQSWQMLEESEKDILNEIGEFTLQSCVTPSLIYEGLKSANELFTVNRSLRLVGRLLETRN